MKCNSCNDDGWMFEAHTIDASHQTFTSFLDVTISCAVQEQGVPSTALPCVELSPAEKCFYQQADESNSQMTLT